MKSIVIVLLACFVFSCGNKELESRVAKLEGRVSILEGKKTPTTTSNSPTISTPSNTTASTTPTQSLQKPEGPLPTIKFKEESFDFGEVKEGDVVEHIFSFVNEGEAPLIISDAKASCGCTVPEWPKEPIPIDGEGQIKVRFNSKSRAGIQNKTVNITSNAWPTVKRLKIKVDVKKEG